MVSSASVEGRRDFVGYLIFFVWPAVAFFRSIFKTHEQSSKFIIVSFFALCGYFFPFSFSDNVDVVRHAQRFMEVSEKPFSDFYSRLTELYTSNEYKPDVFQPLIEYTVSRFTSNYAIYFAVLGALLGYGVCVLVRRYGVNSNGLEFSYIFILFVFVFVMPYRIAGFRQFMAMLLYLYSAIKVFVDGDKRYNLIILLTALIHFGFLGFLPFFFLVKLLGRRYLMYYTLILMAFLANDVTAPFIEGFSSNLEGELQTRVSGYADQKYIEKISSMRENVNIYIVNQVKWTAYFFFALLLVIHRKLKSSDMATRNLYAVSLSSFIFLMLMSNLETTFIRFAILYILLCCLICFRLVSINNIRFSQVQKFLLILVFSFNLVVSTRKAIEFTGIQTIFPGLFVALSVESEKSVLDLVK